MLSLCWGRAFAEGINEPVLVSDPTSIGHPYLPVLVTTRSSTGHDADQYWFVFLSFRGGQGSRIKIGFSSVLFTQILTYNGNRPLLLIRP